MECGHRGNLCLCGEDFGAKLLATLISATLQTEEQRNSRISKHSWQALRHSKLTCQPPNATHTALHLVTQHPHSLQALAQAAAASANQRKHSQSLTKVSKRLQTKQPQHSHAQRLSMGQQKTHLSGNRLHTALTHPLLQTGQLQGTCTHLGTTVVVTTPPGDQQPRCCVTHVYNGVQHMGSPSH